MLASHPARARAALPVVAGTVLLLLLIPALTQLRTDALRRDARAIAEPVREAMDDLRLLLAAEARAVFDFARTGDSAFFRQLVVSSNRRDSAVARLTPLAQRLGQEAQWRLKEMLFVDRSWRGSRDRLLRDSHLGFHLGYSRLLVDRATEDYIDLQASVAQLGLAVREELRGRSELLREAERMQRRGLVGVGVVALLALLAIRWLLAAASATTRESEARQRELNDALATKTRLLHAMSHEVRNALGIIDGQMQLLELGRELPPTPGQLDAIRRIRRTVRSAKGGINDFLELARLTRGDLKSRRDSVDLALVVQEAVEECRPASDAARQSLETRLPKDLPHIRTDADRVKQVLHNLLSNAVKYTPPHGRIRVSVEARDRTPSEPRRWVAIDVHDSGSGIPEDSQERVFEEFTRFRTDVPGIGLGLAIARSVARNLGGDVTVSSAVGRGSTFTLWLPSTDIVPLPDRLALSSLGKGRVHRAR